MKPPRAIITIPQNNTIRTVRQSGEILRQTFLVFCTLLDCLKCIIKQDCHKYKISALEALFIFGKSKFLRSKVIGSHKPGRVSKFCVGNLYMCKAGHHHLWNTSVDSFQNVRLNHDTSTQNNA